MNWHRAPAIDHVPRLEARAAYAKQAIRDKLIERKESIVRYGDDRPDFEGWTWRQASTVQRAGSTEADNV